METGNETDLYFDAHIAELYDRIEAKTDDVDLLRRQRDFIADMWNQVKQGLKAGKSAAELKKTLQFTEHGIFARDKRETEDMIESMCERAQSQPDWNPGPGDPK